MRNEEHDWLVFHRVRFDDAVDGNGRPFPGPSSAEAWRFYPSLKIGADGFATNISDEWGGFGLYPNRAAAEEVFNDPQAHLPFLAEAAESYHALLVPYAHHGEVDWRGTVLENETFGVAPSDPGGPLLVITSAGYENPGREDIPRIIEFTRESQRVIEFYETLSGNLRSASYIGALVDGHDSLTATIWKSDEAMMAAAYKPGYHRTQIDRQRKPDPFIDRSSFSRTRILASKGTWDGSDPVHLAS